MNSNIGSRLYITIEMVMRWWPSVGVGDFYEDFQFNDVISLK